MEATTKRRRTFDMPLEEDFADMDKELYTAEEAYDLTMKDIKAIYDPETGEYMNDRAVRDIEQALDDAKHGRVTHYDSLKDFYKEMGL